jgi:hypothetical protein
MRCIHPSIHDRSTNSIIGNAHKSRSFSEALNVVLESITHIGLTCSPQLYFYDLCCQPIADLRFSLVFKDELATIEW